MPALLTPGVSPEARRILRASNSGRREFQSSAAFSNQVAFDELFDCWNDCRQPNWDGYGARAVTQDALNNAWQFLVALPLGCPLPSVGAEPDGDFTFEWHHSARRTLSVSVTPDGNLHYAALIGANRAYGTEAFFGEVPLAIINLIARVQSA